MSLEDRSAWNQRYQDGFYANRPNPCRLLVQWCDQFHGNRALDIACGTGRNSRFLASRGFHVTAVDCSDVAIEKARTTVHPDNRNISYLVHDLDDGLPTTSTFDLIIVVRYLNRAVFPQLRYQLNTGGHLLIESHIKYDADNRPLAGPESPEFRLEANELRTLLGEIEVLYEYEGLITDPDGQYAALSQLIARQIH